MNCDLEVVIWVTKALEFSNNTPVKYFPICNFCFFNSRFETFLFEKYPILESKSIPTSKISLAKNSTASDILLSPSVNPPKL